MSSVTMSPGTMADDATVGTVAWSNPDNAKVSDDVYAVVTGLNQTSHYLKATNFGFSIPTGATINGVLVEVEGHVTAGSYSQVANLFSGSYSADKAGTGSLGFPSDAVSSFGSSNDLWGKSLTSGNINDATFGVGFKFTNINGIASIDHIRITVYYTESSFTSPFPSFFRP